MSKFWCLNYRFCSCCDRIRLSVGECARSIFLWQLQASFRLGKLCSVRKNNSSGTCVALRCSKILNHAGNAVSPPTNPLSHSHSLSPTIQLPCQPLRLHQEIWRRYAAVNVHAISIVLHVVYSCRCWCWCGAHTNMCYRISRLIIPSLSIVASRSENGAHDGLE